ncbi:DUF2478 domain-containing protein [Rhodalgimonas zhirmunskyi]|uniref:DUF2478 domain-containing protein n=1 Tax=Rhodalgimonas zhirmunskyi TaxID=2964767 RepID=A0AAJ1UE56_9RHOB|nr:DUF2478 domain-containing protein [Rhodoalgimonas zhirmunskyi]MDQ2094362.1 DUF2478 domain-containing protein [Rhodoalgimonas zhirmunskyi]
MQLAHVLAPARGEVNRLLEQLAAQAAARGLRVVGAVQIDVPRADGEKCDMDLALLPDGPVMRISQDLGPGARGCTLDTAALEGVVAEVAARLAQGADLLIVNKFGKHEGEGRGFREVIATALGESIPVIVGANAANLAAYDAFTDGLSAPLPAEAGALNHWLDSLSEAAA